MKIVEEILSLYPSARNSDKELLLRVWEEEGLLLTPHQVEIFKGCTSDETITRKRRELQESGLYLATEPVRKSRFKKEIEKRNEVIVRKYTDPLTGEYV